MTLQHKVQILTEVPLEEKLDAEALTRLRVAALAVLRYEGVEEPLELTIVLTDDESVRELNRRFRGVDRPTDVLSFSNETRGPFALGSENHPRYLGDIVLSVPTAQRQAEAVQASLGDELQLLIVHGTLHLLGYDHATEQEKAVMWAHQAEITRLLGLSLPLPE